MSTPWLFFLMGGASMFIAWAVCVLIDAIADRVQTKDDDARELAAWREYRKAVEDLENAVEDEEASIAADWAAEFIAEWEAQP